MVATRPVDFRKGAEGRLLSRAVGSAPGARPRAFSRRPTLLSGG